jgi:hypothetical protein
MEVSTVDPDLGDNGTDFFTLSETLIYYSINPVSLLCYVIYYSINPVSLLCYVIYYSINPVVSLLGLYCSKLHTLS